MSIGKLYFRTKWFHIREQSRSWKHYRKIRFLLADCFLFLFSFFINPYRALRKHKEDLGPYGETPLSTLGTIFSSLSLSEKDIIFELGSGRGRTLFYLASFTPCHIVGVEKFSLFYQFTKRVASLLRFSKLTLLQKNFLQADYSKASVIYLYGTALSQNQIEILLQSFKSLPKDARIITISFKLESNYLLLQETMPVTFPWGSTNAFIHRKI